MFLLGKAIILFSHWAWDAHASLRVDYRIDQLCRLGESMMWRAGGSYDEQGRVRRG